MKFCIFFRYVCLLLFVSCIGRNRCNCDPVVPVLNLRVENSAGQNLIAGPGKTTHYNNMTLSYNEMSNNLVYSLGFQPLDFDTSAISFYPPSAAFYFFNMAFDIPSDTIGVYFRRKQTSCCSNQSIFRVDINGVETKPDAKGFYVIKK